MEFAQDDWMTWPYLERQLILVVRDNAVERLRRDKSEAANSKWSGVHMAFLKRGGFGVVRHLREARERADRENLPFLVATVSQAKSLIFPNGHPLPNVVYVGDPGVAGNYYPVASFHRFLFEGKVAEAVRLLRSLGATEISIDYVEGFSRDAVGNFSISTPASVVGEIGGAANRTNKSHSGVMGSWLLPPPTTPAQIPKDLIWFNSETLWKEVADARLEDGLRAFTIAVNYTDDFGINASLKAKITRVGLDLGGTFTEYQETVWKISGTFAETLSPDATDM